MSYKDDSLMKKKFFVKLLNFNKYISFCMFFLENSSQLFWRFRKKPYLCIAFETEVYGRLAQLVQSIWFTPRGSGVRIPQRPHPISIMSGLTSYCKAIFLSVNFLT